MTGQASSKAKQALAAASNKAPTPIPLAPFAGQACHEARVSGVRFGAAAFVFDCSSSFFSICFRHRRGFTPASRMGS
jgi:hypothetical protein